MRVLCLSYEYPPLGGGGSIVCQGLAKALVNIGHDIDIVTSHFGNLPYFEQQEGVNIYRVQCLRREISFTTTFELMTTLKPMYRKACELITQQPYDVNHTHFIIPTGVVSHKLYRKTGLPYVITAHGSDVPGYNPDRFQLMHKILKPFWRRIVKHSEYIISPSTLLKHMIHQQADARIVVVHNGYYASENRNHAGDKKNIVLLVTRMFERKGVQYLINAIQGMETEWEFVIVGDGPYLPKLKQLAAGLDRKIRFTGHIKGQALYDLYKSAKIFVFPSSKENFPVVLLEAMDAGCAIITTQDAGCSEVVGRAAIRVAPRNAGQIRSALIKLMYNDSLRKQLVELAGQRIAELSWSNIVRQTDEVLTQAASLHFPEQVLVKGYVNPDVT